MAQWLHFNCEGVPVAGKPATGPTGRSSTSHCYDEATGCWYHHGGLGLKRCSDLWVLHVPSLVSSVTPPAATVAKSVAGDTSIDNVAVKWTLLWSGDDKCTATSDGSFPTGTANGAGPPARCKGSLSFHKGSNSLILFGGKGARGKFNDMWSFDLTRKSWAQVAQRGTIPPPRSSHSTVIVGGDSMFLFGGIGANKYGDMYRFSIKTSTWAQLSGANPGLPPRSSYGSLLHDATQNRLLVFGGLTCGQLNDVVTFDLGDDAGKDAHWDSVASATPAQKLPFKRGRHTTALLPNAAGAGAGQLLMFGGTDLRKRDNHLWSFDLASTIWLQLGAKTPPPPMEGHTMIVCTTPAPVVGQPPTRHLVVSSGWMEKGWATKIYTLDITTLAASVGAAPIPAAAPGAQDQDEVTRTGSSLEDLATTYDDERG